MSKIGNTIASIDSIVEKMAKDDQHELIDIVDQSQNLREHYELVKDTIWEVHIKLSDLESYANIGSLLESFQRYVAQCDQFIATANNINFTEYQLMQLKKKMKVTLSVFIQLLIINGTADKIFVLSDCPEPYMT